METIDHKCEICKKKLNSKRALRNHCFSKNHYRIRCGFCQKGFAIEQAKTDHERMVHTEPTTVPAGASTCIYPPLPQY